MTPEEKTLEILTRHAVDFIAGLPCDRNKNLYTAAMNDFRSIELSREEEGVGICAGAQMAGARPVMLIQNSGMGNMINAMASLTRLYNFALPILMSWRGRESETIDAQKWMGEYVIRIMDAMNIPYHEIYNIDDIDKLDSSIDAVYSNGDIAGYLYEPAVWKGSEFEPDVVPSSPYKLPQPFGEPMPQPQLTRYGMIEGIADSLAGKGIVCNIGIPCKELYDICDQPSNFYMLGSMGMATPIALGMALCSDKPIVSIDGDGSVLMNPSTLATIARTKPKNLTVLCIDNGAYGSTGNQATATSVCSDLGIVARGFGLDNIVRTADPAEVSDALSQFNGKGPLFIHAICKPGNAKVANITLSPEQIRKNVEGFLQS